MKNKRNTFSTSSRSIRLFPNYTHIGRYTKIKTVLIKKGKKIRDDDFRVIKLEANSARVNSREQCVLTLSANRYYGNFAT